MEYINNVKNLKYGFSFNGSSDIILDLLKEIDTPIFQILLNNPINISEQKLIKSFLRKNKHKSFIVHSKYQYNFANPLFNSLSFQNYFDSINSINVPVVVHFGKKKSEYHSNSAISVISNNILEINNYKKLVFEFSAGQNNEMGSTIEELRKIQEKLDYDMRTCIDTQHVFARGLLDFDSDNEIDIFIDSIIDVTNKRSEIIHLNDSKVPFGSRIDRHEKIGDGYIWKKNSDTFFHILNYSIENKISIIFEF